MSGDDEVTRLVLIRHGESVAQVEQFVSGHETCRGLSDLGRRQVEALRDRLARTGEIQADVLLTSLLPRAIETAQIVAPAIGGLEAIQDCELCEIHPGESEGLGWAEFQSQYLGDSWDPEVPADPGGESWMAFAERVAKALRRYAEDHAGRTVVAAVHGGVIEHSFSAFLDLHPAHGGLGYVQNSSITEWRYGSLPFRGQEPRWRLVRFNDAAHLLGL